MATTRIEYMCSYCGIKQTKAANAGRPMPGTCSKKGKTRDGKSKPHSWVVNRKF